MLHVIGGEVDRADVIGVDEGGALEGAVELLKNLAEPGGLGHAVDHNEILALSVGAWDDELPLQWLGEEVGA
jgi:hypothetical protein